MSKRRIALYLSLAFLAILVIGIPIRSQFVKIQLDSNLIVGRNVNMIHGTQLPGGDPYLQRQNEPSIAASTRNPNHLLAGVNDYRTIDMPFEDKVPGQEVGQQALDRDAWLGVLKSFNGGQSWITELLHGFPQDTSDAGNSSLLRAFGTAADPVVRAGTNGLFYYAGIAFNRVDRGSGVVFVARYIDLNNQENADTIKYDGVSIVDQGNAGQFLDKPWMAVDIPRAGHGYTTFPGNPEEIPCGNVYVAYSAFVGKTDVNVRSKILFARSIDCGRTWGPPTKLSETQHVDQGATIAIDPNSGAIYVAWRRFASTSQENAIILVKSTDGGLTFTKPAVVHILAPSFPAGPTGPFDQRTTATTFRTNSHPTIAADHLGNVYLAWAERQSDKRSKIVLTYSTDSGMTWSSPAPVDNSGGGHQFMPSMTFAGGKLMLTWYDQRNDIAGSGSFTDFIEDSQANNVRHTVDVRVAEIDPANSSNLSYSIQPSKQVSRYLFKLENYDEATGDITVTQLQHHFTGFEMFQKGTVPFLGDYIDITAAPVFVPTAGGEWRYNTDLLTAYHAAWEDTRDVKLPGNSLWPDWSLYRAPNSTQKDPYFPSPNNGSNCDYAGMMNQNVYTACISKGFVASSPGNTKPLDLDNAEDTNGFPIARAFTVNVKNMTDEDKSFRLTIEAPQGVTASFVQYFDIEPNATNPPGYPEGFPVDVLTVAVAAQSSLSLPVFVNPFPENPEAWVEVHVTEEATSLSSIVTLNPDPTNPVIDQPIEYEGPHIKGSEVHNPHIKGNSIKNASGEYPIPHIKGLNPAQLDMINSDTANPHIKGDVLNPHIKGTDIESPHIKGESISEITWDVTNEGNTTTPYTFDIFTVYNPPDPNVPPEQAIQFQLLIYKVYTTPIAEGCELATEEHHELIANIPNPHIKGPHIKGTPPSATTLEVEDVKEPTFWLNPGEKALIKLWAIDPKTGNGDDFSFGPTGDDFSNVNAEGDVTSQAHNTDDLENGIYTLPGDTSVPPGPSLVSPLPGDVLDNGCETTPAAGSIEWDFDWADVPGAMAYHLYVLGPDATIPLVNDDGIAVSSFHYSGAEDYIIDANRVGWTWMVRAYVDNAWTGWSEVRSFDVEPATDCQGTLAPEINFKVSLTESIADGGSFDFGARTVGGGIELYFMIENLGTADLALNGTPEPVAISGADADQFTVQMQPASSIAPGQSSDFAIIFHPTSAGAKTAWLLIANDDADENPYDVTLQGNGTDVGEGPVAYYPFNGNANDESGNGHNGTIHGSPIYSEDRNGNTGGALNFDGTSNYVELPDESSFDLPQITVVAIAKVPDYSRRNPIISKGSGFGAFTVHMVSPEGWPYYTYQVSVGNETEILAGEAVPQNQFFHLVSTYDSGSRQLRGYLNGVLKNSVTCQMSPLMNNQNVTIGLTPTTEFFKGVIDEIRIYNRVLSASEVQSLFAAQSGYIENAPLGSGAWTNMQPSNQVGQSFITTSPLILNVDVSLLTGNPGPTGDTITMKILSSGGVLLVQSSQYVPAGFDGWLTFYLPQGLAVAPGTTLRLQLEDTNLRFGWRYAGDTYPGGELYFNGSPDPSEDFFFRINYR